MKRYSTKFIKEYINGIKDEIDYVECGMREDWSWTAKTVYENGKFCKDFEWDSDAIEVAGIRGSYWATPIMAVHMKDGHEVIVECWYGDSNEAEESEICGMKAFAAATGGMDYKG